MADTSTPDTNTAVDVDPAVADAVRSAFAAELVLAPDSVHLDTRLVELSGLDSVKLLRVVTVIESTYDIGLDDELLYQLQTVRDVVGLVGAELAQLQLWTQR